MDGTSPQMESSTQGFIRISGEGIEETSILGWAMVELEALVEAPIKTATFCHRSHLAKLIVNVWRYTCSKVRNRIPF